MKIIFNFALACTLNIFCFWEAYAAGLPVTRFVYTEKTGPADIVVVNPDNHEVLVQTYMDLEDREASKVRVFPSLFTLPANGRRVVKVYGLNTLLSQEEEVIRYLNVATLPPESGDKNSVRVILTAKYKVLIRSNNIPQKNATDAVKMLDVTCENTGCHLVNNSSLNVIFANLSVNGTEIKDEILPPKKRIFLAKNKPIVIDGKYIDDTGNYIELPRLTF
ncbi:fimbrial chaperone protein PefD [Aeromonas salmonicida]|uniref:fimbrial biogenesis chaperone n=1 Tax=Aeromonas salmonicida TaxID=645 RepID=UPI0010278117|nr:fimbria/pilus periplasmic chaperone [Aeromonas salmonicida]VFB09616.1 fimbrial chaperone protein PefD [Aeromonas salmonicida]